jgi:hypothetical protein
MVIMEMEMEMDTEITAMGMARITVTGMTKIMATEMARGIRIIDKKCTNILFYKGCSKAAFIIPDKEGYKFFIFYSFSYKIFYN